MRALYWDGRGLRFDSAHPTPAARIEDRDSKIEFDAGANPTALVKVHLAGICSTDLQILKGYMGFTGVLGHEFVGTVSEGPRDWVGKRVVGEINFACGACDNCRRDL